MRSRFVNNTGTHEIVGTVAYDPTDSHNLLFTPISTTLPINTLDPVNAIIDPMTVAVDSNILTPVTGTRYLILNPIGHTNTDSAPAWAGAGDPLIANANDIIEWNGSSWSIIFGAASVSTVVYITNLKTGIQYKWDGEVWTKSFDGEYRAGYYLGAGME